MTELERVAALQKQRYFVLTERELHLLHWCVEQHAPREAFGPQEDLELKDLEARLSAAVELPLDDIEYKEGLVALLPEHLQAAARRLIVYNQDDEHVAVAIWCEGDVVERAKERGIQVTREQAQRVIRMLDDKQDASIGISWDVIDVYLDELVRHG